MTVAAPPANKLTHFINGQWTESRASEWRDVVNPATGETIATVPMAEADEVNAAIERKLERNLPLVPIRRNVKQMR